ncbi:MAG: dockerin type I repeat-containing protein [Candidatus Zixiibacteriota bacterium]
MKSKIFAFLILSLWVVPAWQMFGEVEAFAQRADRRTQSLPPDSIPFTPAVNYGTGLNPSSVFCADLDGDGDLDLAVANYLNNTVSVLKNDGNGTFQTKVDYIVGNGPSSVFCADLDGDGDLDLAVANTKSNNVSILKNNSDGTFQSAVNYKTGGAPRAIFCADLDGDDDLDLAVADYRSNSVSILKNNGDGTFKTAVNYGTGNGPRSVFCADLDGDGDLDLAVANYWSDNVSILKNSGDGTFQNGVNYETGEEPTSVFCADLDGDSDLDLAVVSSASDNISPLKNSQDESLPGAVKSEVRDGPWTDLDVRDDSDTVGANRCGGIVSILRNNGDGTFQTAINYGTGSEPRSVFGEDLDGDSDFDLAVANYSSNNVSILKNNGDGTFQTKADYGAGCKPISVFSADLDGDGDFDLAVTNYRSNSVSILKNLTQVPANQPPWAFHLVFPCEGDTTFHSVNFYWQTPYDPNFGDQIRYDLYVSTTPSFDDTCTTVHPNLLISRHSDTLGMGTYYWKVKAKDEWGAFRWSEQTCSFFNHSYLTDTLICVAFCPVDIILTDPKGDSIGLGFGTIPGATYDTTQDYNHDGNRDDIATLPNRLVGDYMIRVFPRPVEKVTYSLGIRIDGGSMAMLTTAFRSLIPQGVDTFHYYAPRYLRGDANCDWTVNIEDVIYLIDYLFKSGPAPVAPLERGDATCDGIIGIDDVMYLINYLFERGPAPSC